MSCPPPQSPERSPTPGSGTSGRSARRPSNSCRSRTQRRRPRSLGPRSEDRERVVAHDVSLGEATTCEPSRDPAIVRGEVSSCDAVHPELRDRLVVGFDPRITARRDHGVVDPLQERLGPGAVPIEPSPSGGTQDVPVPPEQDGVDLRSAGVHGEQGRPLHGRRFPGARPHERGPRRALAVRRRSPEARPPCGPATYGGAPPHRPRDAWHRRRPRARCPARSATAPSPRSRRASARCGSRGRRGPR